MARRKNRFLKCAVRITVDNSLKTCKRLLGIENKDVFIND